VNERGKDGPFLTRRTMWGDTARVVGERYEIWGVVSFLKKKKAGGDSGQKLGGRGGLSKKDQEGGICGQLCVKTGERRTSSETQMEKRKNLREWGSKVLLTVREKGTYPYGAK